MRKVPALIFGLSFGLAACGGTKAIGGTVEQGRDAVSAGEARVTQAVDFATQVQQIGASALKDSRIAADCARHRDGCPTPAEMGAFSRQVVAAACPEAKGDLTPECVQKAARLVLVGADAILSQRTYSEPFDDGRQTCQFTISGRAINIFNPTAFSYTRGSCQSDQPPGLSTP